MTSETDTPIGQVRQTRLPLWKGPAMSFYERKILPKCLDMMMKTPENEKLRQEALAPAREGSWRSASEAASTWRITRKR